MTALRLIQAYEQARVAHESCEVYSTHLWRQMRDAEAALRDHLERHGPVMHGRAVYAVPLVREGLLVVRGVRLVAEMDGEAKGEGQP